MTAEVVAEIRAAALGILGRERYARLLGLTPTVRHKGRLFYWHADFMARVAAATGRPFVGLDDFLAAFDGAPEPEAEPPAPPPPAAAEAEVVDWDSPESWFDYGYYETNHNSIFVLGDVESVAGALASLVQADTWDRAVTGREVVVQKRAYLVYRVAGEGWCSIVARHDSGDMRKHAKELSGRLRTRAFVYDGSDTAMVYELNLYDSGKRIERWYWGDDDAAFDSSIRDEDWAGHTGGYEYLCEFYKDQGACERGWSFASFFADANTKLKPSERRRVVDGQSECERIDYVASPN